MAETLRQSCFRQEAPHQALVIGGDVFAAIRLPSRWAAAVADNRNQPYSAFIISVIIKRHYLAVIIAVISCQYRFNIAARQYFAPTSRRHIAIAVAIPP
jgi:hypothetical protein